MITYIVFVIITYIMFCTNRIEFYIFDRKTKIVEDIDDDLYNIVAIILSLLWPYTYIKVIIERIKINE